MSILLRFEQVHLDVMHGMWWQMGYEFANKEGSTCDAQANGGRRGLPTPLRVLLHDAQVASPLGPRHRRCQPGPGKLTIDILEAPTTGLLDMR